MATRPKPKKKTGTVASPSRGRPRVTEEMHRGVRKFPVVDNVPIPSHARGSLRDQMPLDDMEPGQSFRVPWDKARWANVSSMLNSLRNYTKQHPNNFVVRAVKEEDDSGELVDFARVWRTLT